MANVASMSNQSLTLSKKAAPMPSLQPLELHHLSHDLRGPLNSILGFSELLLEGIEGPLNETQSEDVLAIYQSAQNLLQLINNMVDISKLEAGSLTFDFGPVDLNQVLDNVSRFDFGSNKPAHLELSFKQDASTPPVRGDAARVEQMVLSLIRFAIGIKRAGEIVISIENDTSHAQVQLNVVGVTLPRSELESLFELVVRIDTAGRSDLGKGGLDLPLARRLAESHNGRVLIESNEVGTMLYLKLPYSDETVTN